MLRRYIFLFLAACATAVLYLVTRSLTHQAATHMTFVIIAACIGVPLVILVIAAFLRGMTHHTLISVTAIEPPKPLPQLPAPAEIQPVPARVVRRLDPFTADGETWTEIVERAEREELLRSGPREARIVRFGGCEGPGCREALDDRPWT